MNQKMSQPKNLMRFHQSLSALFLAAVIILEIFATSAFANPCMTSTCIKYSPAVTEGCRRLADQIVKNPAVEGVPFVTQDRTVCFCRCTCFGAGTTVSLKSGDRLVEKVSEGELFRTPAGPTKANYVIPKTWKAAPVRDLMLDNGKTLLVSENHPLILEGGIVAEAKRLAVGATLVAENGAPVKVTQIKDFKFDGELYNFLLAGKKANGEDRILFASGIQSGDLEVQSFHQGAQENVALKQLISKMKD